MTVSEQGYERRLYAIEWECRLLLLAGVPFETCEAIRQYCGECLDADFDDGNGAAQRPTTDDQDLQYAQMHFDNQFSSPHLMPSGKPNEYIPTLDFFA